MTIAKQELLFHCFPAAFGKLSKLSIPRTDRRYQVLGLAVLRSILDHGMLLTPEDVKIRRHVGSEQEHSEPIIIPQTRASFTLSSLGGLQRPNPFSSGGYSHLDIFGHFSIGLDPIAARDFDMSPVFYFYDAAKRVDSYPLIASLVHALTETREILSILTLLEERSIVSKGRNTPDYDQVRSQFGRAQIGLLHQTKECIERLTLKFREAPLESMEGILPIIETDRRPLWNLVEAIDLLSGLLQAADSASLNSELLYFSQHEWRLTKVLNSNGYSLSPDTKSEPHKLHKIRAMMLRSVHLIAKLTNRELTDDWLQKCWVVLGSPHTQRIFREYIRLVLCPKNCESQVKDIVERALRGTASLPTIVSI